MCRQGATARKALRPHGHLPKTDRSYQLGKEANNKLNILKAIMIVAVVASALTLGACAQKHHSDTGAHTSTTSSHSTGYSK